MKRLPLQNIVLFLIVVIGLVLRIYQIDRYPPSLSWDEVSIGYNAYSILKTGRDEHGKFFPLDTFVAYGDYKPPLAVYATVPFVALFGLNDFAVRLPSVLFGTITVLMTYFLVVELLTVFIKGKLKEKQEYLIRGLPILSAGLFAISPWHINISRAGFEANIALLLVVLGITFLLRALSKPKYWIYAWFPFAASVYTFNSARYFVPIFGFVFCLCYLSYIRRNWKYFVSGVVLALIVLSPIIPHLLSKEARLRFAEVNIFTDSSIVATSNARITRENGSIIGKILQNRRVGYARSYLIHFFDNLQPDFLFITGDGNPKFSIQDVGQLYIVEASFLIIGLLSMFLILPQMAALLLFWIICAIIPAATARETPHALRILNTLPTWQIFVAFGIIKTVSGIRCQLSRVMDKKKQNSVTYTVVAILIVFYIVNVAYYLHTYYLHYPREYSGEWQYGYKQALQKITSKASLYHTIAITDAIGRPYMYTLFYTKTDPSEYRMTARTSFDAAGFFHVHGFGKYVFGGILPSKLDPNTLYIWDTGMMPKEARIIDTVRLLDGTPVLGIFDAGQISI